MQPVGQAQDNPARRLFEQARDQGMYQRSKGRCKQGARKDQRKSKMFKEGLIDRLGVCKKQAMNHVALHFVDEFLSETVLDFFPNINKIWIYGGKYLTFGEFIVTLDKTDRRLLDLLQQDAALSLETIGEKVNLSRNACWRRLRALEAEGFIKKRVALLDPKKLGLGLSVFILVRTSEHSADWQAQFKAATRDIPEIMGVHRMTGELDYLIRARVAHMADYDRLYQLLVSRVALSDVSASFVMEDIKDTHHLPL